MGRAENLGAVMAATVTIDAQTTAAGEVAFDHSEHTFIDDADSVRVVAKDGTAAGYQFDYAVTGGSFHVRDISDGTEPADATDVGTIEVRIEGRR